MTRIRIVLILTENWTMRPAPDVADLVTFAVEAERAGLDAGFGRDGRVRGDQGGLVMLTQSLAVDHAHQWLRANVVCLRVDRHRDGGCGDGRLRGAAGG